MASTFARRSDNPFSAAPRDAISDGDRAIS
jgi:hypothetical protein